MAGGWRLAGSLKQLRSQVNTAYPNRSKLSDGTIGDEAHQAQGFASDHNPNVAGVVTALDITNDPANGCDVQRIADNIIASRDARVKYLIFNDRICVPSDTGWVWVYHYEGSHRQHLHISVWGDYDNTNQWDIGGEPMIEGKEEHYQFANKLHNFIRGNDLPREGFAGWVGKTWLAYNEALVYDQQAEQNLENLRLGQLARKDSWRQQILDRDKTIADLQKALTNEKNKPPVEIIKEVEKIVEVPVEVIKEVPTAPVDEQVIIQNWLLKLWNSLFKK